MRIRSGNYEIIESGMFFMDDRDSLVTIELQIDETDRDWDNTIWF